MALEIGSRLGHYDVTALIGEGGMGQVYQVTDTKLNRQVALKILPEAFAEDPDRLARFQREAKVLASLNHPGIAAIYGLEEADGTRALVLELVEGPTLADRIAKGPIPLDEALVIAKQIAEALEAAHEAGVVHRDLKPANIKVREDGTVKVLDFGLAKALEPTPEGDPSQSPTLTAAATQMGVIMGTAAYMSPEQARGKPVDKRADIWAFGCVLYEMLTGTKPFPGDDVSQTLARVIDREPDWGALPTAVPPVLSNFLHRCLQKNPKKRIRDIGDVSLALEGAFETAAGSSVALPAATHLQTWQRPLPAAIGALTIAAVAGLSVWGLTRLEPTAAPAPTRLAIAPRDTASLSIAGLFANVVISPDGTRVVYTGPNPSRAGLQLNLRHLEQLRGAPLRGGEGGTNPFFSPDGEWIGFLSEDGKTLQRVSTAGGPPLMILSGYRGLIIGATWGADNHIILGTSDDGLLRIPSGGGEAETLTTLDTERGYLNHSSPFIIPGHEAALFVTSEGDPRMSGQLAVLDLVTREVTHLGVAGARPHYASTGHIVFVARDESLRAVPFDAASLSVTGTPVLVAEGVVAKEGGAANFSISDNGRLVYIADAGQGQRSVVLVDREGNEEPLLGLEEDGYESLHLSPDGSRLVLEVDRENLWTYDMARGVRNTLTNEADARDRNPLWSPDGARVVFSRRNTLMWTPADGTGIAEELVIREGESAPVAESWSSDGRLLFMARGGDNGNGNVAALSIDSDRTVDVLVGTGAIEGAPDMSPDGQWIAYHSDVSGRMEIYTDRFPGLGDRQQISLDGGRVPLWSPDGRELFYLSPNGRQVLTVPISIGPTLSVGSPTVLFDGPFLVPGGITRPYDLTPDGQRFVMVKTGDEENLEITVVLNWFEELKRLVPTP